MPSKRKIRNVVESVLSTPWMILPEKLEEITEILSLRSEGVVFTEHEIRTRIGLEDEEEKEDDTMEVVNGVAIIPVHGVTAPRLNIMSKLSGGASTQLIAEQVQQAMKDDKVKTIVLDIDSPGGSAVGNEELSQTISALCGQGKDIYASVNGMAASAGYYIASAADKIYASPSSMVGSIGAMLVHREASKASEEAGVKFTVIRSTQFKADGNEYEVLSPQAKNTLEERVNAYSAQFIEAVARNRDVPISKVESDYGKGKVMLADAALAVGMIDGVASLSDLLGQIASKQTTTSDGGTSIVTGEIMNPRIKASLFARGLIASLDASDEVCEVALAAYFSGLGLNKPETDEETLSALTAQAVSPGQNEGGNTDVDLGQLARKAASEERHRTAEIRSTAKLMGVSDEEIVQKAIDGGLDVDAATRTFLSSLAEEREPVDIVAGPSALDKFSADAVTGLMARTGDVAEDMSQGAQVCSNMRMLDIARQSLNYGGQRTDSTDDIEVAAAFLAQGGDVGMNAASNDPAYHGAGRFPNVTSVLANKMLDRGMQMASASYPFWTGRMPDLPDFKPSTIVAVGEFNLLPLHQDGRPFEHSDMAEGATFIKADSYGDEFVLTPQMVVDDNLDAFQQALRNKGMAHELTLNQLAVDLLVSDPTTIDGKSMFDADHKNDIGSGSGGAPDSAQLSEMRKLLRQQVGLSGVQKLRYDGKVVLVGPNWETQTQQTLQSVIYPTTDQSGQTTVPNVFRGRYTAVVEPMFDDLANANQWYLAVDPGQLRGIVHAFQRGYGRGGRRRTYFREETQCRHYQIEGRFAVAAVHHQAMIRNYGS